VCSSDLFSLFFSHELSTKMVTISLSQIYHGVPTKQIEGQLRVLRIPITGTFAAEAHTVQLPALPRGSIIPSGVGLHVRNSGAVVNAVSLGVVGNSSRFTNSVNGTIGTPSSPVSVAASASTGTQLVPFGAADETAGLALFFTPAAAGVLNVEVIVGYLTGNDAS
jgi:hypothetical protein